MPKGLREEGTGRADALMAASQVSSKTSAMTPREILRHLDSGAVWPAAGGAGPAGMATAYQTALAVRALRIGRGEVPRGYKVGFTNHDLWPRYQVFAPIWGSMWDSTVSFCEGDRDDDREGAGRLSLGRLCQPRLEPEAVFGFKTTPPANASLDELFAALKWVAPGFEIVQSHQPDWKFTPPQTVADGGLHGRLLVGRRLPMADLAQDAESLHRLLAGARVGLHRNGELVEEGAGAKVLGSPLQALKHFLAELRACPGATDIAAGNIVTTGTWTDAWPVCPGETWTARFDSALPALEVSFGP
jgi:2-keto-4-pentenoate hydratase